VNAAPTALRVAGKSRAGQARAAGLIAAFLVVGLSLTACSHGSKKSGSSSQVATSGSSSSSPAVTTTPASTGPAPTPLSTVASVPLVTAPPTALHATATFGDGVTVHLTNITYDVVSGTGPGVIVGQPAVTFALQITNSSSTAISLDNVQVDVTYGTDATPGVPANQGDTKPFSGSLATSKSASGTYEFSIPTDQQKNVSLTVWYAQGKPTVLLTGSAR
jgi:hypothetical protein